MYYGARLTPYSRARMCFRRLHEQADQIIKESVSVRIERAIQVGLAHRSPMQVAWNATGLLYGSIVLSPR